MTVLAPKAAYEAALATGRYQPDAAQARAIDALQALYEQLQLPKAWWPWRKAPEHQGVYLHGEVGAGKTWLMDMFYQALTVAKWRVHFHQFMREVHRELKILQGRKNPLTHIAHHLRKRYRVICFDELFVEDIADAMLLGELLQQLFAQGLVLVMTSNVPPAGLYRNGLQRARFLPAIAALEQTLSVLPVAASKDYRWRSMASQGVYFSAQTENQAAIYALYSQLTGDDELTPQVLTINHRPIAAQSVAQDVVWFDFHALCAYPRSIQDYVVLSQRYRVFFVDQVPILTTEMEDVARYFIGLIDVLYDARCRLVMRAAAGIAQLYQGQKFQFEFQRTLSRLHEMQGEAYWL